MVSKVSGCWNFEFEYAPLKEANYVLGGGPLSHLAICLTSVARGTDAKLEIGC